MNKQGLIEAIVKATGLKRAEIEKTLDATVDIIQDRVSHSDDVTLMGFGTFYLAKRKARKGHDPHRDKAIEIPAMNIPKFRVGKEFKTKANTKTRKA
ncbi:MAG: HU family DNA-binding protein [Bdellovibrionota bacterium]